MSRRLNIYLLLFSLSCLPIFALFGARVLRAARHDSPYVVAYDEAYTLSAISSYLNGGYRGFRCKASQMSYCYGGTQTFLDLVTLAPVPKGWLLADRTSDQQLEIRWPYLAEYPNVAKVLRWQRILFIGLTLLALAYWASPLGLASALLFLLLLASSYPFVSAWNGGYQGIKSDFPGAFFAILQMVVAWYGIGALKAREPAGRVFLYWLGLHLVGLAATTVRASNLPLWGSSAFWFLGWLWATRPQAGAWVFFLRLSGYLCGAGLMTAIAYLFLHPQTWVSFTEAKWIFSYLQIGFSKLVPWVSWAYSSRVFGQIFRELVVLGLVAALFARARGGLTLLGQYGYIFLAILPQMRNALILGNGSYYLTPTVLALAGAVAILRDSRIPRLRHFLPGLSMMGIAWNLVFIVLDFYPYRHELGLQPEALSRAESLVFTMRGAEFSRFLVDRTARLPVRQDSASAVEYFDSLTDSPAAVSRLLLGRPQVERIFVSCWQHQTQVMSPPAQEWSTVLGERCSAGSALRWLGLQQIIGVLRGKPAVVLERREAIALLAKKIDSAEFSHPSSLSVRAFSGTSTFADGWSERLFTSRSGEVSGRFVMGYPGAVTNWTVSTTCLRPVFVRLGIRRNGRPVFRKNIELEAASQVCARHPWGCKLGQAWAARYFRTEVQYRVDDLVRRFERGDTLDFSIKHRKTDESDSCWVNFNDFAVSHVPR